MATTLCTSCGRQIGYGAATICPYCGKKIAKAAQAQPADLAPVLPLPRATSADLGAALKMQQAVPASVPPTPVLPDNANKGMRQLREGLDKVLRVLRGEGGRFDFEVAIGEIAVALALLRASDNWDVAEAGLDEALREFLAYTPADDARGRRVKDLQERLRKWFGAGDRQRATPAAMQRSALGMQSSSTSLLRLVDDWTVEAFDLERLQVGRIQSPTVYCESLEEFYGSFFAYRNLSPHEQARGVQQEAERARQALEQGGGAVLGVNWPGRGCFLNGEAFAKMNGKASAAEALRCPSTFPHVLSTAVHEKLGHGLLTEYTTRGKEIRSVHLEQHEVARNFLRRTTDDPREALLQDKWNILLGTSKYSEEGFSTWMESKVLALAASRLRAGVRVDEQGVDLTEAANTYTADTVLAALRESGGAAGEELATNIEFLVNSGPAQRNEVAVLLSGAFPHTDVAANTWQRDEDLDQLCAELFGQPLHYVVGFVLVEKLEQRLGARSVPFALALAGNVSYGLDSISNADLRVALHGNPLLRMDVRLALIGTLEGVPHDDPDALFQAARRELSLTPPTLLPRKASR